MGQLPPANATPARPKPAQFAGQAVDASGGVISSAVLSKRCRRGSIRKASSASAPLRELIGQTEDVLDTCLRCARVQWFGCVADEDAFANVASAQALAVRTSVAGKAAKVQTNPTRLAERCADLLSWSAGATLSRRASVARRGAPQKDRGESRPQFGQKQVRVALERPQRRADLLESPRLAGARRQSLSVEWTTQTT